MTWRLLYVRPLAEKKVVAAIKEVCGENTDCYLPQERVWRGIGARRRPTDRPLLPSMVFADVYNDMLPDLWRIDGVKKVVMPPPSVMGTVEEFVLQLRFAQDRGAFDKTYRAKVKLKTGDRVQIAYGPFAGFAAQIIGMNGSRRAKLVADVFGKLIRVNAVEADLEPLEAEQAEPGNAAERQKFAA